MVIFTKCEKITLKDGTEYVIDEFQRLWKRNCDGKWRLNINHSSVVSAAFNEELGQLEMEGETARLYFALTTSKTHYL